MQPSPLLVRALFSNAAFSALSGVALTVFAVPLGSWLGIPTWICAGLGIGLVLFAVSIVGVARNPSATLVRQIIASDVAWVIGAVVILVGFPDTLSTQGSWTLAIVTIFVADFALLQWMGLRQSSAKGHVAAQA